MKKQLQPIHACVAQRALLPVAVAARRHMMYVIGPVMMYAKDVRQHHRLMLPPTGAGV